MSKSDIEWTGYTWTPIRAQVKLNAREIAAEKGYTSLKILPGKTGPHCEKVSEGCRECYSESNNGRCLPHNGTGLPFDRRARDLVNIFMDRKILEQPFHWPTPRLCFVCSQTDLFGEWVTDEMIDELFAVMALTPHITYQVLTKRAARMRQYYLGDTSRSRWEKVFYAADEMAKRRGLEKWPALMWDQGTFCGWPRKNIHLGVSIEDEPTARERIEHLFRTPAAVRFVSYEPALAEIDFADYLGHHVGCDGDTYPCVQCGARGKLDWAIIGGESGSRARPFLLKWARRTKQDFRAAGVPLFLKQLGRRPIGDTPGDLISLTAPGVSKNPELWPPDLQDVRDFPA
jgi:protein gp37